MKNIIWSWKLVEHSSKNRLRTSRHLRNVVHFIFIVLGSFCVGVPIVMNFQEDYYIASVLRTFSEGGDYSSVAERKPLLVSNEHKEFAIYYIQRLIVIHSLLQELKNAMQYPDDRLRFAKLNDIRSRSKEELHLINVWLGKSTVSVKYKERVNRQLNDSHQNIINIIDKKTLGL